ncbi:hypothetical protein [Methylocella silvestris]|uniref:hypothetical protein n=1 Tax=Methylocella silvestris TaxID=199596 RepID=UPI00017232F2|nr:hypothetical protein [Methylocella silvestris]
MAGETAAALQPRPATPPLFPLSRALTEGANIQSESGDSFQSELTIKAVQGTSIKPVQTPPDSLPPQMVN